MLVASVLLSPTGCTWYQPKLGQQHPVYGRGLGPPTPIRPVKHFVADCHVCPSAVAATIEVPTRHLPDANAIAAVDRFDRWPMTLNEALSIALENSEIVRSSGLIAAQSSNTDRIRAGATAYDQRIAEYNRDGSWGIFDPVLTAEMQWQRSDLPPGLSFGGIGNRPNQLDQADFDLSLDQLTPSGTRWSVDYSTDYLFNPARPASLNPNPQHFSTLQFGVVQPLLQGLGYDVNLAPIRIASAQAEQTGWEFKREMLALVRSVETAYWDMHALQRDRTVLDETIPMFAEIVRVRESQHRSDAITDSEVARAEVNLLRYEQQRMDILSNIEEQQLVLRNLLGLDPSDGRQLEAMALPRIVLPIEEPQEAVRVALNQRPDILRQRLAVYVSSQQKIVARDSLRPKLDGVGLWRMNGLDNDVGGSLGQLFGDDYNDWELGIRLEVPLGRRKAWADVRSSDLEIRRQRALLEQVAHQASFEVADAYRRIYWLHRENDVALRRISAMKRWQVGAKKVFENPPPGTDLTDALESYVDTLKGYVEASHKQHAVQSNFNSALARLEEVKGTLLAQRDIEVQGDPTDRIHEQVDLPSISQPDAAEPPSKELPPQKQHPKLKPTEPKAVLQEAPLREPLSPGPSLLTEQRALPTDRYAPVAPHTTEPPSLPEVGDSLVQPPIMADRGGAVPMTGPFLVPTPQQLEPAVPTEASARDIATPVAIAPKLEQPPLVTEQGRTEQGRGVPPAADYMRPQPWIAVDPVVTDPVAPAPQVSVAPISVAPKRPEAIASPRRPAGERVPSMMSIDSVVLPSLDQPVSVDQAIPAAGAPTEPTPLSRIALQPLQEFPLIPSPGADSIDQGARPTVEGGLALPASLTQGPGILPDSFSPAPKRLLQIGQPESVTAGPIEQLSIGETLEMPREMTPATPQATWPMADQLVNPVLFEPIR